MRSDVWMTLFVLGVLLIEPVLLIIHASTPPGTGLYVQPLIAVPVAGLALVALVWWVLRRDARKDD